MSQSAVSQAIAELEKHYGVRLFDRLAKKLFLTQAGEKLLGYASHLIRLNDEVEVTMKMLGSNSTIRIGASVTVGSHVLPGLVSEFKSSRPGTAIEVVEDNTEKIEAMLLRNEIDLGLVEGEVLAPEILVRPFMDDELVIICARGHRFASQSSIEPHELEQENFIIREKGSGTRKTFEDMMTAHQVRWHAVWTCNNADTIRSAVAQGHGISAISRLAVAQDMVAGLIAQTRIQGISFRRQFKLIYHKNKYLPESMQAFIGLCLAARTPQGQGAGGDP